MIHKNRYNHRSTSLASAVAIALLGNSGLALAQEVVLEEVGDGGVRWRQEGGKSEDGLVFRETGLDGEVDAAGLMDCQG